MAISGSSTTSLGDRVERPHGVDDVALAVGAGPGRPAHVEDRVSLGIEADTLKPAGQEAAVPLP